MSDESQSYHDSLRHDATLKGKSFFFCLNVQLHVCMHACMCLCMFCFVLFCFVFAVRDSVFFGFFLIVKNLFFSLDSPMPSSNESIVLRNATPACTTHRELLFIVAGS